MNSKDSQDASKPVFEAEGSVQTWDETIIEGDADKIRDRLQDELTHLLNEWSHRLHRYTVLVLYNDETIDSEDADRIYEALSGIRQSQRKDVLLVLVSRGGLVVPAYQISKLCREWSKDKFVVGVPRHAKSAATMICLGADAVHMGPLGHLGPIDPQFTDSEGYPVSGLALQASLRMITKWVSEYPGSHEMWAEILMKDKYFDFYDVGALERHVETSVQYGERLLIAGKSNPERAIAIARKLVYEYQDHGFAIDRDETREIFGEDSVVENSNELAFSEEVYRMISQVDKGLRGVEFDGGNVVHGGVAVVGALHDSVTVLPRLVRRRSTSQAPEENDA